MAKAAEPEATIRLVAPDLDDTVLGDPAATRRWRDAWLALEAETRPLLVYNTGRSVEETLWLILDRAIPEPEFIIGGIGTEVHDPLDLHMGDQYQAEISPGWNLERAQAIVGGEREIRAQEMDYLGPYKLSWYWNDATKDQLNALQRRLREAHVEAELIYSDRRFLDVIPLRGGKGRALVWLCQRIGIPNSQILVSGAGANNASMFALPEVRGILLGNASASLTQIASSGRFYGTDRIGPDGILEGLAHFGIVGRSVERPSARVTYF